MITASWYIG